MPGKPSERSASWAPLIVTVVVLTVYGRALGRFFTSEDFLLVRFLSENPPWRDLPSLFAAPWLEISVVKFWRPISTLLYAFEIAAFGAGPFGYNLTHVLVHALNAALVWRIARRLAPGRLLPLAAALLFAVHPLHPNAVVFGASFATLFAGTFCLGAVLAWQRGSRVLALGLFALALGSYEAAVVLPAVILAWDLLVSDRDRRRPLLLIPFLILVGLYFLLRRSLFGVFVGGYEEQGRNLLAPQIGQMLRDLATSVYQLHVPVWDHPPAPLAIGVAVALLIGLPLVLAALGRLDLRRWLCGWIWTLACLAPFAFRPVVPGNGRYWYLASVGVALSLAVLGQAMRGRWLAPSAALFLGLFWGVLLQRHLTVSLAAGETARAIQGELVRIGEADPAPVRFLTRHPDFLTNERGVPIAGVLRYGVWDAVHPPFVEKGITVLPLPPLQDAELLPVFRGVPGSRVYAWDAQARQIREVPPAAEGPAEMEVLSPPPGAAIDPARDRLVVVVPPGAVRFRLIVVTRGNSTVIELPGTIEGGALRASLPEEFCRSMARLYGGEQLWWIEAWEAGGGVVGWTAARRFRVAQNRSLSPIM